MFKCGDAVVYGTHGICTVIAFENRWIDRKNVEYYVLQPMGQTADRYYVPTQNQTACARMRRLLTVDEINRILHSEAVGKDIWVPDEGKRKHLYRDILASGDRQEVLCMINTLHKHRILQEEAGRKFHMIDENFLRDAEKMLNAEFSLVLGIPEDHVAQYILSALTVEEKTPLE